MRFERPSADAFWRGAQALMITVATFALVCLPLIAQAFRLAFSGRYVSQTYFWRSAPRGVDALAPLVGNPFHPAVRRCRQRALRDIWVSIASKRSAGSASSRLWCCRWDEARGSTAKRRADGKWCLLVFAIWALGPFLTVAGVDAGLPLPQALARFVPLVENARMPGRAMVCVYLALGVLMALRLAAWLAGLKASTTTEGTVKPAHT